MSKHFKFLSILGFSFFAMTSCVESNQSNNNLDEDLLGQWLEDTSNDRREALTFDDQGRSAFFYTNVVTGEIEGQYQPMEWYTINNYLHQITQSAGVFVSEYDVTDSILTLDSGTPISFVKQ